MVAGAPALPTGVVTFLLTDIEGSTALWDADADGMRRAVELHDGVFERTVTAAGGTLLKARGEGDSTFSVFGRPTEAVTAALEARRALERAEWPAGCRIEVRFAVHMGEVSERDGDYYGTAVNRAGRLRSLAVGGQVLVSQAVTEIVADNLPADASLLDLGKQELRGLTRPERVWALVDNFRPVREALGGLCPYKGLLAFQPEDSELYFGREPLVTALLGRILERNLLVVVGASGSGKSSLVRAGVIGELRRGALPGSADWPTVIVTPGEHPSARLQAELAKQVPADGALPTNPSLGALVHAVAGTGRAVVVVDQMEELFTSCRDAAGRERYVDELLDATEQLHGRVLVVCALRADFYGHCAAMPRLAAAVSGATVLLGPMDDRELARAIEAPAELAGLRLEPGLVELMLHDLAREPGSLPLLSHALLETWRRRSSRTLTIVGYQESGGVRGAIAHTAEIVWNEQLTSEQRAVARRIFLRLTELGEGTEDTRRRVARAELVSGSDAVAADEVLASLADARLVTVDDGTAEVAHEALIREWPRLRGWLDDDRDGLRIHRHLTRAATDWESVGRDPAELYRGPRLAATREWLAHDPDAALNELEAAFIAASTALEDEERAEADRAAEARERAHRRVRRLLIGTAVALVVAIVAVVAALSQRNRADDQATRARAASVSAEVDRIVAEVPTLVGRDRTLAALLATQASRLRPDAATRGAVLDVLNAEPRWRATYYGGVEGYAWAARFPDGRRAAVAGRNGVDLWNLDTGSRLAGVRAPNTSGVAVSPDGRQIAAGNSRGIVTFRDARTLGPVGPRINLGDPVRDLAYSPDGARIAVAVGDVESTRPATLANSVRIWDVTTGRPVGPPLGGHTRTVNALAFTPDGRLVVTGGNDGLVVFHDASSGAQQGGVPSLGAPIYNLSFSPDGTEIVVTAVHGTGRVFDVVTRQPRGQTLTGIGELPGAAFSPDGAQIVTTGESAQVYDAATLQPVGAAIDTQHGPARVVFGRAGKLFFTGFDGTLIRWVPVGSPTIARTVADSPPSGGSFNADGTRLVLAGLDDIAVLYRTRDLGVVATLTGGTPGFRPPITGPTPIAFSQDGRKVAVGNRTGRVQLFDARSGRPTGSPIESGLSAGVSVLTFSPDGRTLVAGSNQEATDGLRIIDAGDGTVETPKPRFPYALSATYRPDGRVLIVTTGAGGAAAYPVGRRGLGTGTPLAALGPQAEAAAYSPDGKLLAVGSQSGKVQFYDAISVRPRGGPVVVSSGIVATLNFSRDSRQLIVEDADLKFRLVDVPGRAPVGDSFAGGPGFGYAGFSRDGGTLALPSPTVSTLWDLHVARWRADACTLAGRSLSRIEWERYLSASGPYRKTCPS